MNPTLPALATEADIKLMVDTFYAKVNQDALLDPVFNGFAHVDWPRHLPVMYDFWSSILLGSTRYKGRPFPKHLALPIDASHFLRWQALFHATVDELFSGEKAAEAKHKASQIAAMFEYRIRQASSLSIL